MKLTISRTSGQKGIFKPVTVYQLNVEVNVSLEEMALLKEVDRSSNGWEYSVGSSSADVIVASVWGGARKQLTARDFVGKITHLDFETVEELERVESQLILRMKCLKQGLEGIAAQKIENARRLKQDAASFASEGPHEVDL